MTGAISRRTAAILLGLLTASVIPGAWQEFTLEHFYHFADAGFFLQAGWRLLLGQVPYRDFVFQYPPLTYLSTAAAFRLFGSSMWAGKLPLALFTAAALPATYRWLRAEFPRGAALAGTLAVWGTAPVALRTQYANAYTLAPALVAFIQLLRMRPGRLLGPAWWAGIACGVTIAAKHNVGILVGLAMWTRLFCVTPFRDLAPGESGPRTAQWMAVVRVGAFAVAAAALGQLWRKFTAVDPVTAGCMLAPAAIVTGVGAVWAWRQDARADGGVQWPALLGAAALAAGGVVCTTVPWVAWLAAHGAVDDFLALSLILPRAGDPDWTGYYAWLFSRMLAVTPGMLAVVSAALCTVMAVVSRGAGMARVWTALAAVALLGAGLLEDGIAQAGARAFTYAPVACLVAPVLLLKPAAAGHRTFLMVVCVAWYAALCFPAATINHVSTGFAPGLALGVALAWRAAGGPRRIARVAVVLLAGVLVTRGWAEWGNAALTRTDGGVRLSATRAPGPRGGVWVSAAMARRLGQLNGIVQQFAPAGAPVLGWPSMSLVSFYTGHPNPTLMDTYHPGFLSVAMEDRVLEQLRSNPPALIVMRVGERQLYQDTLFAGSQPRLDAFIRENYAPLGRLDTWGVLRRADLPSADVGAAQP